MIIIMIMIIINFMIIHSHGDNYAIYNGIVNSKIISSIRIYIYNLSAIDVSFLF